MASQTLLIRPASLDDIPAIAALAHRIWHAHYPSIISIAQIDYMLGQRYHDAALREQITGEGQWLDLALLDGQAVGFAQYLQHAPGTIKLDKLYLDTTLHGQGLGSRLLAHVEARARELGASNLTLAVNKHNEKAIATYRRNGFTVTDSVQVDIGQGYIMDDYVMSKSLGDTPLT